MVNRYEARGIVWIDLENPTREDILMVAQECSLSPIIIEELATPTAKPRVDVEGNLVYAVFHFPTARHTRDKELIQEVDVVLSKKFLLTVHYQPFEAIDDLRRTFETETLLMRSKKISVAHVFFELMNRLYRHAEDELAALSNSIETIETRIFSGEEKEMVAAISKAGRELLTHKRVLEGHAHILTVLENMSAEVLGEHTRAYMRGLTSLQYRTHTRATALADILGELRKTNMALLTTRQNEIMKNLTIMAFVTFPLTVVIGMFSMNTISTPVVGTPYDFYLVLGIMLLVTMSLFGYFKFKKWL